MALTIDRVSLGPCEAFAFDQGARAWAIVLPGAGYSTQAPLLWYARRAALEAGRNVLVLNDAFAGGREDEARWVEARAEAALSHVRGQDQHPLLITKSLTSLAAPLAARERLAAVWLTPLISADGSAVAKHVLAGLQAATEPRLLVGGSADATWDGRFAASLLAAQILELPGADHSLEVTNDAMTSLAHLKAVTVAVGKFLEGLK
ncbi:MAG: alpha/beta hydrolase [Chloroflexi bacterium]|nr:alpha/beta hydrolase [Chloroflexota bacterium]